MDKIKITKEDTKRFNETVNGAKKYIWKQIGIIIEVVATILISLLIIFSNVIPSALVFYLLLYVLLVIVVLGGEMIGVYYGALEQFFLTNHKENK